MRAAAIALFTSEKAQFLFENAISTCKARLRLPLSHYETEAHVLRNYAGCAIKVQVAIKDP